MPTASPCLTCLRNQLLIRSALLAIHALEETMPLIATALSNADHALTLALTEVDPTHEVPQ